MSKKNQPLGKIWIAGAKGRVAKEFIRLLQLEEGIKLLLTDTDLDVSKLDDVTMFSQINRPDIIINCAGITDVELCEKNQELAYRVNTLGARNLAVCAQRVNAEIVQLSTDDVFDGKQEGYYTEFDKPSPQTVYGKSKLAGEEFVRNMTLKHLIVRSSWVYGSKGENFVNSLLKQAQTEKEIFLPDTQVASPTSAEEVAKCIFRLLNKKAYGVYHATCQGHCSRYEFASRIVEYAGLDTKIVPAFTKEIPDVSMRPANSVLYNMMLRISDIELPIHWEDALRNYLKSIGMLANETRYGKE